VTCVGQGPGRSRVWYSKIDALLLSLGTYLKYPFDCANTNKLERGPPTYAGPNRRDVVRDILSQPVPNTYTVGDTLSERVIVTRNPTDNLTKRTIMSCVPIPNSDRTSDSDLAGDELYESEADSVFEEMIRQYPRQLG
jgi:hypothetical protein